MRAGGDFTAGRFSTGDVVFTFNDKSIVRQSKIIDIFEDVGLYRLDDGEQVGEKYIASSRPEIDRKVAEYELEDLEYRHHVAENELDEWQEKIDKKHGEIENLKELEL